MREASWCFDDGSTGPFINNGCSFETGSPLRGAASALASCSAVQTFYWDLNPNRQVLFWAARFKYTNPAGGCGIVRWIDYNDQTVDLRFGDDGHILVAVNDIPLSTGRRIITAGTEFHLQGEIYFTSFIIVRTRLNQRALYDLNYGPATQPAGTIRRMEFGSFIGTGSGTCLIDDAVINNSDQDSRKDFGYPGNWTGRTDRPNAAGTFQDWTGNVSDINDADDATFISSNVNGAKASYFFPAIVLPTGRNVLRSATYLFRARSAGTPRLRIGIRTEQAVPMNERIRVFFDGIPTSGAWQLRFNNAITAEIAFDADSLGIENIIGAHPDIGSGNIIVVSDNISGPLIGWILEFVGRLAGEALPPIEVGGSFGGGVNIHSEVIQKGNQNFFHPPVGELWDFVPAYVQPVLQANFSNHQYHSLLKPDTHSIWSKSTLAPFQALLEYFDPNFAANTGGQDSSQIDQGNAVVNDSEINTFGINAGTGEEESSSIPIVEPPVPPPVPPPAPDPPPIPPPEYEPPPPGGLDLRLLPGSPALNAGTSLAEVTEDIRGRSRDASPSAGAYEGEY